MKHKSRETAYDVYNGRINSLNARIGQLKKKDTLLAILKVLLFFTGIILLITVFPGNHRSAVFLFAGFFIAFVIAAFIHETVLANIRRKKTLLDINRDEITALGYEFLAHVDNGVEFRNSEHPYTSDLDIFGDRSLFHYINRAVTSVGRKLLALRLQAPAEPLEIKERQDAVKELTGKLDFRQNIRAHGMSIDDTSQKLESLYELFNEPFFIKGRKLFIAFIHIFPLITMSALVLMFYGLPVPVPLALILSQMLFNRFYAKKTARVYRLTSRKAKILKAYSGIIANIEKETFESAELLRLKKDLYLKERNASQYIKRLAAVMESFDVRGSDILSFLISNTLFWELHCVLRIEKWREETAPVIHRWFDVIAAFETLSAFANLHFNNPTWVFPKIREAGFILKTTAVGHPLIPQKERVCNSISMEKEGNILMVTGPNMAGKSTFLRTIGVNAVLALAGAPVCADAFKISPFQLLTSMQTTDSLDKHLSLFYAELQRLKMVLDGMADGKHAFFMIDEMLKGTNALDRQKGSIVLIKQLARLRANGIVATHDLELTKLENQSDGIVNYHFDGYVEDDKLLFDYTLKPGICESFNALALMKKIGIEL